MCQWTGSALVQVMACCLFSTKPLPKPMLVYYQLDPQEQTSVKFESKYKIFENAFDKAMGELKLELQSRNAQFGSKSAIFCPVWPSNWQMTLKNNKAPRLCCFKLCAPFYSHCWIQTGVTVRKRSIQVKISNFLSSVTLKFDGWLWKTIWHFSYAASNFVHHFIAIGQFKLEL